MRTGNGHDVQVLRRAHIYVGGYEHLRFWERGPETRLMKKQPEACVVGYGHIYVYILVLLGPRSFYVTGVKG